MATNQINKRGGTQAAKSGGKTRKVLFELRRVAREVHLAGTFNNWHPSVTPMILIGNDLWAKELALPPGTYEYLFVVDGKWIPDPRAIASVPNPFGGYNSALKVE